MSDHDPRSSQEHGSQEHGHRHERRGLLGWFRELGCIAHDIKALIKGEIQARITFEHQVREHLNCIEQKTDMVSAKLDAIKVQEAVMAGEVQALIDRVTELETVDAGMGETVDLVVTTLSSLKQEIIDLKNNAGIPPEVAAQMQALADRIGTTSADFGTKKQKLIDATVTGTPADPNA